MFQRPSSIDGVPLFYLKTPRVASRGIQWGDPTNILIQLRLMRWCYSDDFDQQMLKSKLMHDLFREHPHVTTVRVGRLIRDCVQYETHMQTNPTKSDPVTRMWWKFNHPMDLAYGIEYRMVEWLPEFNKLVMPEDPAIPEDWDDEFRTIREQSPEDDIEFFCRPAQDMKFSVDLRPDPSIQTGLF